MQGAAEVDVDHLVPLIDPQGVQCGQGHDARIIDEDVDRTMQISRGSNEFGDACEVRDVERAGVGAPSGRADLVDDGGDSVRAAGPENDGVAEGCEVAGGGFADSPAGL